jgi:hypothetical protein
MNFIRSKARGLFYLSWLILNLLLAKNTGLLDDEAYYWVYSRFLDWGYYDHPPMIAILIRAGNSLFHNELGVRFFIVLMSTMTLYMIDRLCEKRNDLLFYTIAASMFLLQIGSILAVPDLPLMFFIALYFTVLKIFLAGPSWKNSLLLGLVMACMLYSKYHAVLVIFFTLVANPGLLKKWQTYLAAVFAFALFLPHIVWQIEHDLPSVNYHLFERNATQYQFEFTLQYVIGQVLLAGPLIGWLVLFAAFIKKPADPFEKTLKWSTVGIFGLFLIATFKGRSEANWTVPAFVGMIVLAHQQLTEQTQWRKWAYWMLVPSLLIAFTTRMYMMADVKPQKWLKKDEFHKTKEWALAIKDSAKYLPVVFPNSYQRASQYWFYTGRPSFALNTIQYRRSNYNFWPLEDGLQGKKALLVYPDDLGLYPDSLPNERKPMHSRVVDSFYSHSNIFLEEQEKAGIIKEKTLRVRLKGNLTKRFATSQTPVFLALYAHDNDVAYTLPGKRSLIVFHADEAPSFSVDVDLSSVKPGNYRYKWAIESCIPGWPTLNSSSHQITVPVPSLAH